MNLPDILNTPAAGVVIKGYQIQTMAAIEQVGLCARAIDEASQNTTKLGAALGAIDAGLVNLVAYHAARNLPLDRVALLAFLGERLDTVTADLVGALAETAGGVQ